ncbi:MAG: Rne/Rng family ribonuclease [Christensenellales bacterium]|mgnify:CR=1 FL=1|jgi:ribonuclease G
MSKQIVIDVQPVQTRIALTEGKNLSEYYVERPGKARLAGNIYKGRVANVLPGMEAAFVSIGLERNAFLYAGDIAVDPENFEEDAEPAHRGDTPSIKELVTQGQELLVQVTKDPSGSKGARITTHITLPGRLMVLMPTVDYVGVSRKIEEEAERCRLKALIEEIRPPHTGLIIRTACREATREDMEAELRQLTQLWESIQTLARTVNAPACLYCDSDLLLRAVRDMLNDDIERVLVNQEEAYAQVRDLAGRLCPQYLDRIELFTQSYDIFDYFNLEEKVDRSFSRRVWLKSGGYLIIDHTEALTVIDVNTGKYVGEKDLQQTILRTNLEAAEEIARQVRLRDIGGIIVIDFIDMLEGGNQQKVIDALKEALSADRTRTHVVGMTGLGLVEMTRKKVRQRVFTISHTTCPYCNGSGRVMTAESVALKVLKEVRRQKAQTMVEHFILKVHADVADYLERENLLDESVEVYRSRSSHIEAFRLSGYERE